jgi:hypothetical protein
MYQCGFLHLIDRKLVDAQQKPRFLRASRIEKEMVEAG